MTTRTAAAGGLNEGGYAYSFKGIHTPAGVARCGQCRASCEVYTSPRHAYGEGFVMMLAEDVCMGRNLLRKC